MEVESNSAIEPMNASVSERNAREGPFGEGVQLPTPSVRCVGWASELLQRSGTLLTRAELESFRAPKRAFRSETSVVARCIGRFGDLLSVLESSEHVMKLQKRDEIQFSFVGAATKEEKKDSNREKLAELGDMVLITPKDPYAINYD